MPFHDGQFTRTWNRTYIQSFVGLNGDPWGDYAQVIEHVFCRRFAGGISGQGVNTFRSSLPLVAKIICLAVHEVGGVGGKKEDECKSGAEQWRRSGGFEGLFILAHGVWCLWWWVAGGDRS